MISYVHIQNRYLRYWSGEAFREIVENQNVSSKTIRVVPCTEKSVWERPKATKSSYPRRDPVLKWKSTSRESWREVTSGFVNSRNVDWLKNERVTSFSREVDNTFLLQHSVNHQKIIHLFSPRRHHSFKLIRRNVYHLFLKDITEWFINSSKDFVDFVSFDQTRKSFQDIVLDKTRHPNRPKCCNQPQTRSIVYLIYINIYHRNPERFGVI